MRCAPFIIAYVGQRDILKMKLTLDMISPQSVWLLTLVVYTPTSNEISDIPDDKTADS